MHCGGAFNPPTIRPSWFEVLASTAMLLLATVSSEPALASERPICKPALTFKDVKFSAVKWETMVRTWTATMLVDASPCASSSGSFSIFFTRQKENSPEDDFADRFQWKPGVIEVSVDFSADEAVESYHLMSIPQCPCQNGSKPARDPEADKRPR
jgi:hypothetical protein